MKRTILALVFCFLLGSLTVPTSNLAALNLVANQNTTQAITQDPVEPESDDAKIVIDAPSKVKAGDLVVLSVEGSKAASFKWIVKPSTNNFLVIDGGKRAVFSSGIAGKFSFVIACANGDTVDVLIHEIIVTGNNVSNPLSGKIAMWCETIQSTEKKTEALLLAQSFNSVASIMATDNLVTPKQIAEATKESNRLALGENLTKWNSFRDALAFELKAMLDGGKLSTPAEHIVVWKQIAEGLKEYAGSL